MVGVRRDLLMSAICGMDFPIISTSKYSGCNYKNFGDGVLRIKIHSVCLCIHLKIFIEFLLIA